jgi:UDP-glucose 4-epimerase
MASRGSVIPLFVDQIRRGQPLTVTDPAMTRFVMSLEEAVDLVVYAFANGEPGDLFVQKAPAVAIGTLAEAVRRAFRADNPIQVIGTRHGEKLYETLLTHEEMARATDLGKYFRVAADVRDLNYDKYFSQGESRLAIIQDYHSHNTRRLDVDEMVELLLKLPYIQKELDSQRSNGRSARLGKRKISQRMPVPAGMSKKSNHGNGSAKSVLRAKPR